MIDCVLILVAFRSGSDVRELLASVPTSLRGLSWHAIVVNNDPDDDLAGAVAANPQARLVEAGSNLGYSGGLNLGLAHAPPSRWTVFLNPDLRLGPDALHLMAVAASSRQAVVPVIVNDLGRQHLSLRREPSVVACLGDAVLGNRWPTRPRWLSETIRSPGAYTTASTVDWATGAALLVPTAFVTSTGIWDADRFFLYSEETDYCRRLRSAGCPILFLPDAAVQHRGGGSGSSDSLYALQEVNRLRYFRKWHGRLAATAFAAVVVLKNLLRCHRSRSRLALRALLSTSARARLPGGAR